MSIRRFLKWYYVVPMALVGFAVFVAIGGWVVMSLWNWLAPALFGLPTLTFWQALALLALCRILFGGFGFGGGGHSKPMSSEERARLHQRMRERIHGTRSEGEQPAPADATSKPLG